MNINRLLISARIRLGEFPRRKIQDSYAVKSEEWKIPNTCYQTWVNHKFGKSHLAEIKNFRKINQDISFLLFDDEKLNQYMLTSWGLHPIYRIFLDSKFGPMRADIFRYCILYERGGYYFDISKGCDIPIRRMHNSNTEVFISFENNFHGWQTTELVRERLEFPQNLIIQWGFGFIKGHPILKNMIDSIVKNEDDFRGRIFEVPKEAILEYTGPHGFTRAVHNSIHSLSGDTLSQAGIDFFGNGNYALKGSYVRYFTQAHYTEFLNSKILEERNGSEFN